MKSVFILAVATVAALGVLVALPVAFVVLQAVFPRLAEGSLGDPFGAWGAVLSQPGTLALVGGTLKLGLSVAAVSAAIGIPLGALRGLFRLPLARLWDLLFLIPFLLPPYIAALSWTMALQPRGFLQQLAGWHLGPLLFSPAGVALVMGLAIFPVVYFAVSRSMAASGSRLAEAARVFGAGPWRAFFRVTLPLSLPAIGASLLLAFTLAIEEYGVPAALGAQSGVNVLTTAIERRLADWPIDLPGAALLSLVLVALALTAFAVQRALLPGAVSRPPPASRRRWRRPSWALAPARAAAVRAGRAGRAGGGGRAAGVHAGGGADAQPVRRTVARQPDAGQFRRAVPGARRGLGRAVHQPVAGGGAALLTGAVGLLAAWCVAGRHVPGAPAIDGLALLPAALPGVVVGVGLILAWNQPFWPATPYGTWGILLLSYTCLLLPYPVRYVGAALAQIGPNLEAAARVHGASAARALRRIVLPLVLPALAASMLMVFAVASRELVTSLLLAPAVQTVSIYVWRQFEQGSVGEGMAMATVAVAASLTLMLGASVIRRRGAD
ncbi:ABC transporter permease subunit [Achromobacter xylosoxidans]